MKNLFRSTMKLALFCAVPALLSSSCAGTKPVEPEKKPVVIAYVGGYRGLVDTSLISPEKVNAYKLRIRKSRGRTGVLSKKPPIQSISAR